MNIYKNTRLLPFDREFIGIAYHQNKQSVTSLAKEKFIKFTQAFFY